MANRRKASSAAAERSPRIIEGVVQHDPCGWISDGGAFVEGAGCPSCGKPIDAGDVSEVTEGSLVEEASEEAEE